MSVLLSRLGALSYRHPIRVLAVWLVVIAGVVGLLRTQPTSMATGLTLQDTPSQRVLDTIVSEVPGAGGTQGSIVVTAPDGGRVDSPTRAAAIADALAAAQQTGHVVDRETKLAQQRDQIRATVTTQVEAKVAADLSGQLRSLGTTLRAEADRLAAAGRGEPLTARVRSLATRATNLATAPPHESITGASALFNDVAALRTQAGAASAAGGLQLPTLPAGLSDPRAKVEQAVADASSGALANLDALTTGTNPHGSPLTVGDRTYRTIRVSADGRTAVVPLQLTGQVADLPAGALDDVLAAARSRLEPARLTMAATAALTPVSPPLGGHEAVGLGIAALVLLLTLGSLRAAGLPILTALAGVFIGVGGAFALSAHYQMTTATPALGLMIGLAVGIDYALFIVHKHRALIRKTGLPASEVIGRAVGTAGGAVVFAGLTVVIALLGLLTLGIGFVNTMALTAATTVVLAVLIAVTALPALLGVVGDRVVTARARQRPPGHSAEHRVAHRWTSLVTRWPLATVLIVAVVLGLAAVPARDLHLGMPSGAVAQPGSGTRTAYDEITRGFGEGANAPLVVTVRRTSGDRFDQEAMRATQHALANVPGVADVALMRASAGSDLALYQVRPDAAPTDPATSDLVTRLRSTTLPGLDALGVTGLTALNIDLTDALAAALPRYVAIVLALSLVVLLLVFRSLLVPVAATAAFLLTMAATAGLVVLAFEDPNWTWLVGVDRAGPVLSFLPIMATGILYGLANDYQVFLGTSMREEHVHGAGARAAVRAGFAHAGRVVVAAAVIMVSVFGGFVLSSDTTIRQFGFALSAGILIDAFLIRMALMPAVLHVAGAHAWWLPSWLDRFLPTIDIEGDRLRGDSPAAPRAGDAPAPEPAAQAVR